MPCVASAISALALLLVFRRHAGRLKLLDLPNERSSHESPTPRSGGVAILAGVGVGAAVAVASGVRLAPASWLVLGCAVALAAVGLVDDLRTLGAAPRLVAQMLVAGALVAFLGGLARFPLPPPLDVPLPAVLEWAVALVWLVGVTNFFNFMDGIDGLAAGQTLVTCIMLAVVGAAVAASPDTVLLSVLIAAGTAVFLLFNWSPASVFLGDVGSLFLGFFLAASPWLGPPDQREEGVFVVAASMSLFLFDPAWTLVQRWRRGAPLTQAHREHAYQRLARVPAEHAAVSLGLHGAATVLSAIAVVCLVYPSFAWIAPAAMVLSFLAELRLVRRTETRTAGAAYAGRGPD